MGGYSAWVLIIKSCYGGVEGLTNEHCKSESFPRSWWEANT